MLFARRSAEPLLANACEEAGGAVVYAQVQVSARLVRREESKANQKYQCHKRNLRAAKVNLKMHRAS